jgi:hypothetical protein
MPTLSLRRQGFTPLATSVPSLPGLKISLDRESFLGPKPLRDSHRVMEEGILAPAVVGAIAGETPAIPGSSSISRFQPAFNS